MAILKQLQEYEPLEENPDDDDHDDDPNHHDEHDHERPTNEAHLGRFRWLLKLRAPAGQGDVAGAGAACLFV